MLQTSNNKQRDKIQELQRRLYQKAKQEKQIRFCFLYDKVYRKDILEHAYKLVKSNQGAPGVDGVTFNQIEDTETGKEEYINQIAEELKNKTYKPKPVKRVYIPKANGESRPLGIPTVKDRIIQMAVKTIIEPIFEADFEENSYGFRPKKDAHQAMDEISLQLRRRRTEVIDLDIAKYFDSIPHNKLMKLVARRIVDKNILRLIKQWLKAPVVEEDNNKKQRYPKKKNKGTPQGGVISPLLANIYLDVLDKVWKIQKIEERYKAKLIRYADDCVILCKTNTERIQKGIKTVMDILELNLNEEKTKVVNAYQENFKFLGFAIKMSKSNRTGKVFPQIKPSKDAISKIKKEIKQVTGKANAILKTEQMVNKLNMKIRGWTNYFYYGHCTKDFSKIKHYTEERMRIHLRRKHKISNRGAMYKKFSDDKLYSKMGLYKIPTTAPWKMQKVKASG